QTVNAIRHQDLIYWPTKERNWWDAESCMTSDQSVIFGNRRAYLSVYQESIALWQALGVEDEPSLDNLLRFWNQVSQSSPGSATLSQLENSYRVADRLCRA